MKFDFGGSDGNVVGIVVACACGVADGNVDGIVGVVVYVGIDCHR